MKNNDALKKHHFWILFGLVPLFVLIAVMLISSGVGGAIDQRNQKIETAKKDIAAKTNPKPNALIDEMDKMIQQVDGKRGNLWESNWNRQKALFTWPKSSLFTGFKRKVKVEDKDVLVDAPIEDFKFGETIVADDNQFDEFKKKEFYNAQYSVVGVPTDRLPVGFKGMADRIEPTQFLGGWERTLRHVNNWGDKALTSEQIWLIMEDIWVQRSMLEAVKSVNDQMGAFERVKYAHPKTKAVIDDPDPKAPQKNQLARAFRSRTWEVTLEVVRTGNKHYLTGTLTNITDRLQVLGIGKTLTLKVWLEPGSDGKGKGVDPVEFKIGSEFLRGAGGPPVKVKNKDGTEEVMESNTVAIRPDSTADKDLDKYPNLIPPGKNVVEIVKVEQVFDTQTVPIRRIEAMGLGYPDSRWVAMGVLKMPKFPAFEKEAQNAATMTTVDPVGGGVTTVPGGGRGVPGPGVGPTTPGGPGDTLQGTSPYSGGGHIDTVVNANKRRYVEVTDQVRRMPVGIVVVVDQSYIQDVLLAFANSDLRFQVTQVNWKRFRGSLAGSAGSGGLGDPGQIIQGGPVQFGSGFDIDSERGPRGGGLRPPGGIAPGPMGPPGPGPGPIGPGPGPIGPGSGGPEPGYPGSGYPGSMDGGLTAVSEAQLTAGLVELSIYGIVSLYEKYTPPADPNAVPKTSDTPTPVPADPKNDPMPMMPMTATPPKMRVRRRA